MSDKGLFEDFKSEKPPIIGASTVNHAIRVKLGLTADQYCFMQYLEGRIDNQKVFDLVHVGNFIGYSPKEVADMMRFLLGTGLILPFNAGDIPILGNEWDAVEDPERDFDKFWYGIMPDGKKRADWPGSKKQAISLYAKARKKYPQQHLLRQKAAYFEFLRLTVKYQGFNRTKMGAPVFLNLVNERFNEDWKAQGEAIRDFHDPKPDQTTPITMNQLKDAYK